jgi:hypothetical protein
MGGSHRRQSLKQCANMKWMKIAPVIEIIAGQLQGQREYQEILPYVILFSNQFDVAEEKILKISGISNYEKFLCGVLLKCKETYSSIVLCLFLNNYCAAALLTRVLLEWGITLFFIKRDPLQRLKLFDNFRYIQVKRDMDKNNAVNREEFKHNYQVLVEKVNKVGADFLTKNKNFRNKWSEKDTSQMAREIGEPWLGLYNNYWGKFSLLLHPSAASLSPAQQKIKGAILVVASQIVTEILQEFERITPPPSPPLAAP